jgi:Histidine kinase-, DNA gyrase B-, and HSP90-like ATPase
MADNAQTTGTSPTWPVDPLDRVTGTSDTEFRRRTIEGVLQSYHSNYDVLAEGVQNAVDAVEDAKLGGLKGPYSIEVTVDLTNNWIGILDTGVGMSFTEVTSAFVPSVSFKSSSNSKRDKKSMYRGFKGVGLTFLAYGCERYCDPFKNSDWRIHEGANRSTGLRGGPMSEFNSHRTQGPGA